MLAPRPYWELAPLCLPQASLKAGAVSTFGDSFLNVTFQVKAG
jgi:hypothetical protein